MQSILCRLPALGIFLFLAACSSEPVGGVIEGTSWRLVNWKKGEVSRPARDSTGIVLSFSDDKVDGIGTCNNYFGNYETQDGALRISGLGATRKLCPGSMLLERDYLKQLRTADRYSVSHDQLKVYTSDGELVFQRLSEVEEAALERRRDLLRLDQLFASDLPQRPLHIYAAEYPNELNAYPFEGTEIPYDLYDLFASDLADNWRESGWGVYAIGKYHGKYLLRIPGRYTSDQIALYEIETGEMAYLTSVASKWCDEGWCNQQDGWLRDLNEDNRFDLVTHYVQLDEEGNIILEELEVYLQSPDGQFVARTDIPVSAEDYPVQR